jgi:predicted PurR-regulated permease PerM
MENELPGTGSQLTVRTVLKVCLTVLGFVTAVYFVLQTRVALTLMMVAVLLAVALNHAVEGLQKRRVGRRLSIAAVILAVMLGMTGVGVLIIPPFATQGKALIDQGPALVRKLRQSEAYRSLDARFRLDDQLSTFLEAKPGSLERAAASTMRAIGGALSLAAACVTVFFLVIFMLLFGGPLVAAMLSNLSDAQRPQYQRILEKLYRCIGGYLGGLTVICIVNAVVTTTFLALWQVPFFLPLGIASGLASLIPYVGTAISAVLVSTLAWITGGLWHGVGTGIYYILYGQFEGQLLGPIVYRRTINLNPLVTLLSTLFLVDLAGIPGAVIAIPVAGTLQILLQEFLSARRERLNLAGVCDSGGDDSPTPRAAKISRVAGPGRRLPQ